jgi:hypothetical protein
VGWGCFTGVNEVVEVLGSVSCELAEFGAEVDLDTAFCETVVDEAVGDLRVKHFFKAEGLCAELNFICTVGLWFSSFVFDGYDVAGFIKFYDVALARESQLERTDWE